MLLWCAQSINFSLAAAKRTAICPNISFQPSTPYTDITIDQASKEQARLSSQIMGFKLQVYLKQDLFLCSFHR